VRANVARSGEIGRLVSNDLHSALVRADLLEANPETGKKLDYAEVSRKLEEIRTKFSSDKIDIQIIGFAKVVGEVMDGLNSVMSVLRHRLRRHGRTAVAVHALDSSSRCWRWWWRCCRWCGCSASCR
jgi:hypothetical protein